MRLLLNIGLLIAFSIGYMEWGGGNSSFIAQMEYEILFKQKNLLETVTHPIILAGLLGQLILLYSAFTKKAHKALQFIGIIALGIVMFFILLAGLLSFNIKMIASTLPFIALSIIYFLNKPKFFPNINGFT